jgi:predicted DNA-binding transcriptional regulator AlpA|nr:helix-turn-helix domain-containing protein [Micromonospora sp. DSM 115978]
MGTTAELWSVDDVSAFLRVPVETLYQWRKRKYGPPAARIGRHLRYDPADVRNWVREQVAA